MTLAISAKRLYRRGRTEVNRLLGRIPRHRVQIRLTAEYHGSDTAGWWVAPELLKPGSIVYSCGVGEDISFDLSVIEKFGAEVYAFDPTPRSIEWVKSLSFLPSAFHFFPYAIGGQDGEALFYPPVERCHVSHSLLRRAATADEAFRVEVRRLSTLMDMLGHRQLDVLKLDVEGAEYEVISDLLSSSISVTQILVEFHVGLAFQPLSIDDVNRSIRQLQAAGFKIFCISDNGLEYSLARIR
ncbi:MAG: FkbM family methyltransferase [Anaerolineae bacterium]